MAKKSKLAILALIILLFSFCFVLASCSMAENFIGNKTIKSYEVMIDSNLDDAGTTSGAGEKEYNSNVTITATTNEGYTWLGWYDGEIKVSEGASLDYTFDMPSESKLYTAKWMVCPVALEKNVSAAGSVGGIERTAVGAETTVTATTNAGYAWLGWYEGETKVADSLSYIFTMAAESKTFTAKWRLSEATLIFNPNGGEGSMSSVPVKNGETLPAGTFTRSGWNFSGWALSEGGEAVFTDGAEYTVTVDGESATLYAVWKIYKREGNYIYFGEYPQTVKADSVTVGAETDSRGYYLGNDGEYYAKVTAAPCKNDYKFSTSATVTKGTVYYFKVEPIKWRILSESDGTALILCESIIANKQYFNSTSNRTIDGKTVYANNYMYSDIREWLNNEFYNTAFSAFQKSLILTSTIDNGEYSTGDNSNPYVCADTNDKIFLPSYRETTNIDYGFNSNSIEYDAARRKVTSDYSRATGVCIFTDNLSYYCNGWWWLRSPSYNGNIYARGMKDTGDLFFNNHVYLTDCGVVPALKIQYDKTIKAYAVTLNRNLNDAGTASGAGEKEYNSNVKITANTNEGYTWLGWYDGEIKVSEGASLDYTFNMPSENKTYTAKWMICPVALEKDVSAAGSVGGIERTAVGAETTVTATTNTGYTWLGWYEGEIKISEGENLSYTFIMTAESKTFAAKWKINEGTVSFNANGGEDSMDGVSIKSGEALPANTFLKSGYYFNGWALFSDGEIVYTDKAAYAVPVDGENVTLYAVWKIYKREGNYIYFGEYPQTVKADGVTVSTEADSRGYCLGNDGTYYAKITAAPYLSGYTFSTGGSVTKDTVYYFKIEPIKWRVLSEEDGAALILCESIIANKRFDDCSNNYEDSEIRAWLNNQFYNTAFNELQKALILTTTVDNSVYSTGFDPNSYICADTGDKIFLPSYREMVNASYGFDSDSGAYDTARRRVTSDYSRATGMFIPNESGCYGEGFWWLRSPYYDNYRGTRYMNWDGLAHDGILVDNKSCGVVPALKIQL